MSNTINFPFQVATLPALLQERAAAQPDQVAYTEIAAARPDDMAGKSLTYSQLQARAGAIATALQNFGAQGIPAGERVLLLYPSGLEYVCAFMGCLAAGAIAVPAYPPSPRRPDERLLAIITDARPALILTTSAILAERERYFRHSPELAQIPWLASDTLNPDGNTKSGIEMPVPQDSQAIAFLQYTSGSTREPRGVIVRHANLLHNHAGFQRALGLEQGILVCWLPLHHDMGLIGNVLQSLYHGASCVLMPPLAFLQNPITWLQAISHYRAVASGGPNFAYELCLRSTPEQRQSLDLHCWQVAITGAEPIRPATLQRFQAAFAPYGFQAEAFFAAYGLAEATLFVAGAHLTAERTSLRFDQQALASGSVQPIVGEDAAAHLVSCGPPAAETEIYIVDPDSRQLCPPGQVGEIWVAGPGVTTGYWQRPQETSETFVEMQGRHDLPGLPALCLRTGDLGFLNQGELVITGRIKEIIIVNGRNHYPQDILYSLSRLPLLADSLVQGGGSVFTLETQADAGGLGYHLAIVLEIRKLRLQGLSTEARNSLLADIRSAIAADHQLVAHAIYFVAQGSIPRTSSGKTRHQECRARLLSGELEVLSTHLLAAEEEKTSKFVVVNADPAGLTAYLRSRLAELLDCPAEQIGEQVRLSALGFKLEHANQLRRWLQDDLSLTVAITLPFDYPTLADLTSHLLARLTDPAPMQQPPKASAPAAPPNLDGLSEDELAARLLEKLRQLK